VCVCVCLKKADLISKTNLKKFEISFRQVFNLYHYHYLNHFKSPFHSFYLFLSRSFPLHLYFSHSPCLSFSLHVSLIIILSFYLSLLLSVFPSFSLRFSLYHSFCIYLSIILSVSLFPSLTVFGSFSTLSLFRSFRQTLPNSLSVFQFLNWNPTYLVCSSLRNRGSILQRILKSKLEVFPNKIGNWGSKEVNANNSHV